VFCHAGVLVCLFVVTCEFFDMMSLKVGYRILNYIMHFWSLIFLAFIFRLGSLNFFSKSFVAVITLSTHSYLEFVCVGCYCNRFLFVGVVQQTLRKLGRCQMTQLI